MSKLIYQRIVSLREYKELSQADLAEIAEVEPSYISKLERGKAPNVSGVVLARIASALETSVDFLLGLTNSPSLTPSVNHPSLKDPLFSDLLAAWELLSELADMGDEAGRNAKSALRLQAQAYKTLAEERLKRKKAEE